MSYSQMHWELFTLFLSNYLLFPTLHPSSVKHDRLAVPKKDGKTRICGDYKVTINPVLEVEQYPLPKPEDLFATLAGGKQFTTLDFSHAYNQLVLDEDSQELVTINTHRGLFRYRRLPFGNASAPAVFQKTMDVILQGMSRVTCYLDDILVTGATAEEHLRNLDEVLTRLKKHGVRLRKDKCRFMESSVEYLGHRVDQEGIHATTSKLQAISEAPAPRNVQELRSFLGLLNYYGRFIPNLSSLIHPLHKLLCKNAAWKWSRSCESAFNRVKQALLSSNALVHYNPSLPLKLAGDASAYGVGAVISHVMEDGSERAIAFASRTLSPSEQNYAQLEREALSLVFGVKKFHAYLYGRQFTLTTDHKPLTTILGPKQGIPTLAAARLQRWALLLADTPIKLNFAPQDTTPMLIAYLAFHYQQSLRKEQQSSRRCSIFLSWKAYQSPPLNSGHAYVKIVPSVKYSVVQRKDGLKDVTT